MCTILVNFIYLSTHTGYFLFSGSFRYSIGNNKDVIVLLFIITSPEYSEYRKHSSPQSPRTLQSDLVNSEE